MDKALVKKRKPMKKIPKKTGSVKKTLKNPDKEEDEEELEVNRKLKTSDFFYILSII